MSKRAVALLALLMLAALPLGAQVLQPHAVVLLYHHVSEHTPPVTSISPGLFEQHLDYLQQENYQVVPLSQLLYHLHGEGDPSQVPDRAVAITFDDAYLSVYETAYPLLRERNMPFTLYVATQPLDQQWQDFFSWDNLHEMLGNGAELGGHSHSHDWLARQQAGESDLDWQHRVAREIDTNIERLEAETGLNVTSFAYPFGESNRWVEQMVAQRGLYGLKQQSGAIGVSQNPQRLPRFPMATGFASMERLEMALDTRPLQVADLRSDAEYSSLTFRLSGQGFRDSQLNCFSSSGIPLAPLLEGRRVELKLPESLPGRNKVNCTAPAVDGSGDFYWFSWQWLVPRADGSWPNF